MKCKCCSQELKENRKFNFKEFCNHSCKAIHQFKDINQHNIRSIKSSIQLKKEYINGVRNKDEIVKNANKKSKELWDIGKHPLKKWQEKNKSWNKGLTKETDERMKLIAKNREGENNPVHRMTAETKLKRKQNLINFYKENPEKHPNRIMSKKGFISRPQKKLFDFLKSEFKDAELEYPIQTKSSIRFADIGIPSMKLDVEYDGEYWHQNKENDKIRDNDLKEMGWNTIRFNKNNINSCSYIINGVKLR